MIFHENRLLADDSQEISCLICFEKVANLKLSSAANHRWSLYGLINETIYNRNNSHMCPQAANHYALF